MPRGVYTRKGALERLLDHTAEGPAPAHCPELGPCLVWTDSIVKGYGQTWYQGKKEAAHRVIYALRHGPIQPGKQVLHRCDNRACLRDEHHHLGTHTENMRDRNQKGRQAAGARHGCAKGSDDVIDEICALYATGQYSQELLGAMYGRSQRSVSQLVLGQSRKRKGC
jgi:hypothetical protein